MDEENLEKIPCKSWRNSGVTSENFWLNLKNHEEILKKCEDPLWTRKFVKCPGKFQKILKILRETSLKILKKRKVNFEEIRWSKKIDNLIEILKVGRSLYEENVGGICD